MSKSKSGKSRILGPDLQDPSFQPAPTFHPQPHSPAVSSNANSGHHSSSTDPSSSTTTAALTAPLSLSITPQVVQVIDTTKWSAPSPDPSGMAYVPGSGLLMVDSEI